MSPSSSAADRPRQRHDQLCRLAGVGDRSVRGGGLGQALAAEVGDRERLGTGRGDARRPEAQHAQMAAVVVDVHAAGAWLLGVGQARAREGPACGQVLGAVCPHHHVQMPAVQLLGRAQGPGLFESPVVHLRGHGAFLGLGDLDPAGGGGRGRQHQADLGCDVVELIGSRPVLGHEVVCDLDLGQRLDRLTGPDRAQRNRAHHERRAVQGQQRSRLRRAVDDVRRVGRHRRRLRVAQQLALLGGRLRGQRQQRQAGERERQPQDEIGVPVRAHRTPRR